MKQCWTDKLYRFPLKRSPDGLLVQIRFYSTTCSTGGYALLVLIIFMLDPDKFKLCIYTIHCTFLIVYLLCGVFFVVTAKTCVHTLQHKFGGDGGNSEV